MTKDKQAAPFSPEQILTRITLKLGQHRELRDILRVVLAGFKELLDAHKALFAICDSRGRIQQAAVEGIAWSGDLDALPISRTVLQEAFESDGPVLLADALTDGAYAARTSVRDNALRMIVAMPVRAQSGLIGILYADSPRRAREQSFLESLDALAALATLDSLVVENARFYAEQRFRARYLARLAHDLRGSLHGAALNAAFLQSASPPNTPDELEAREDLSLGLFEMHRKLSNSSSIAEHHLQPEPRAFSLSTALAQLTATVPALAREHHLTIALSAPDDLPCVIGWPDRLQAALDNLLSNALKFAVPSSTITITAAERTDRGPDAATRRSTGDAAFIFQQLHPLTPDPTAGFIEVSIHNHGPPIAPALLPRLFEAYVCEGGERRGSRSSGLGLAIVAEAVERTGGRVWVVSTAGLGTSVHFTLPRRLATPPKDA